MSTEASQPHSEHQRASPTDGARGRVRQVNGALVARPDGVFDNDTLRWIEQLATDAGHTPLVVELDECILAEESAVAQLATLNSTGQTTSFCVVCNRPSGRALLERLGVATHLALFTHTQDALTGLALADAGYGPGWGPMANSTKPSPAPPALHEALGPSPTPEDLPAITDIDIGVLGEARVGGKTGDFWDVFPMSSTTYCAVLGDVTGSGPQAAAVASLARHHISTAARDDARPDRALRSLNAWLLREGGEHSILTAVLTRFRRHHDTIRVQLARAGHPYPLLVRAAGSSSVVETPGQLLGVLEEPHIELETIVLRPGDAFVLVTDGITEARVGPAGTELGSERLLDALLTPDTACAADIATAAFALLEDNQDDASILVLANPDLN